MPPVSSATAATPSATARRDKPTRYGRSGISAPAEKATSEEMPAKTGEGSSNGSTPSSSRVCTRSAVSGSCETAAAIRAAVSASAPYPAKVSASSACSAAGKRASMMRSVATSAATSSFWFVTDTYSPVPIENAPATSAATPVKMMACGGASPPPSPAISDALVTSPSTAPNTVGRSHPPDTSRCRCDHPAASAAAPTAWVGSSASSPATSWIILRVPAASCVGVTMHVAGGRDSAVDGRLDLAARLVASRQRHRSVEAGFFLEPPGPAPPAAAHGGRPYPGHCCRRVLGGVQVAGVQAVHQPGEHVLGHVIADVADEYGDREPGDRVAPPVPRRDEGQPGQGA